MAAEEAQIAWLGLDSPSSVLEFCTFEVMLILHFFHQHARYRKKGNFIAKLQVGDRVITDQDEKHAAVLDFYDKLVGESGIHYWAFGPALERVAIQYSYTDLMDLIHIL